MRSPGWTGWTLLAATLIACIACGGTTSAESAVDGRVAQFVTYRRYPEQPRLDVVVVVSTSGASGGAALRASVASAIRDRMRELADGESPWLRGVNNPIDVRAFIASAADGSIRSPTETGALAWQQNDATRDGAAAFADAVEAAIDTAPAGEARPGGVVELVTRTLAFAGSPPDAARLIVVVSSSDDPGARASADPAIRSTTDSLFLIVPAASDTTSCVASEAPGLRGWAAANEGLVATPCADIYLKTVFVDYAPDCLPSNLAPQPEARPACLVRAFVPKGTPCDPARGWRSPRAPRSAPLNPALAGMDACEVIDLDGTDAERCRDHAERYAGTASGWCVPATSRGCVSAAPRIVGAAAPPFALIEVVCALSR